MKIKAAEGKVIVKQFKPEDMTASGIALPENIKEKVDRGEVLHVGPGTVNSLGERNPVEVRVGDKIIMTRFSGTTVKIEGEEFLIVHESDILAVLE